MPPIESFYSNRSIATGDFEDLRRGIVSRAKRGAGRIALAPVTERASTFNPRQSYGSFSLEPMYMALDRLPVDEWGAGAIERLKRQFPSPGPTPQFKEKKFNLLWELYNHEAETGALDLRGLAGFAEEHSGWLEDFALFKVIGDYQDKKPWFQWENRYKYRERRALEEFRNSHEKEILFDYWVQRHLYEQFAGCADLAKARGVVLEGEFPLRIYRNSADVWQRPGIFRLGFDAGTPPCVLHPFGTREDSVPCDWKTMAEDGFSYLRQRLSYWERFYGHLRLTFPEELSGSWVIPWCEPREETALGFMIPGKKPLRRRQARRLMSIISENTRARVSVEDEGTCPEALVEMLKQTGRRAVPGTRILYRDARAIPARKEPTRCCAAPRH